MARRIGEAAEKHVNPPEPTKQQLQRQIGRTRESLTRTVEEIKETAGVGYEAVKDSVSGVLDYRAQFEKEPLVWSMGALSAGFALGYALGYGHRISKKARDSQFARFADQLINELSSVGQGLVMPALNLRIKEFFGFDFADLLNDVHRPGKHSSRSSRQLKSGNRKTSAGKSRPRP